MSNQSYVQQANIAIPLIITQQAINTAAKFAQQQPNLKAQQVYLNTLAVYLVNNYLGIMGIETDLTAGDSWNPAVRFAADVADLEITGVGRLECRPMTGNQGKCPIPLEVMDERIGYVVVEINLEESSAHLLGFTPQVTTEDISVNQLLPIKTLFEHISQLTSETPMVQLSDWLNHVYESGWELLENIFTDPVHQLSFGFRDSNTIIRGKKLDFIQGEQGVALCVAVTPVFNSEMAISINLYSYIQNILPSGLRLMLFNAQGKLEMQVESGENDQFLRFQFHGELQEIFSIKICFGELEITEEFIV